jgi:uncharacterized membrane protein
VRRSRSPRLHLLLVRASAICHSIQESYFFLPSLWVIGGIALAEGLLAADAVTNATEWGAFFLTTVSSGRSLMSTIAGALITVAGTVISVVVVALQLSSTQYSPRVLRTLLESRFQQSIVGLIVGVFAYCLVVLHAIHSPISSSGDAVIPSLAIVVGLLLAVVAALAILAYIDQVARAMQVEEIIRRIAKQTRAVITRLPRATVANEPGETPSALELEAGREPFIVCADKSGWVQQAPTRALLAALQPNSTLILSVRTGLYVPTGGELCRIVPAPSNTRLSAALVRAAIEIGSVRTIQRDIGFGIRQLTDIALRGLSPGINGPTTAYEVIVHMQDILSALLDHRLPPKVEKTDDQKCVLRTRDLSRQDFIARAFDQIRNAGAQQPAIAEAIVNTIGWLAQRATALHDDASYATLVKEALLVLQTLERASLEPHDSERARQAAREWHIIP